MTNHSHHHRGCCVTMELRSLTPTTVVDQSPNFWQCHRQRYHHRRLYWLEPSPDLLATHRQCRSQRSQAFGQNSCRPPPLWRTIMRALMCHRIQIPTIGQTYDAAIRRSLLQLVTAVGKPLLTRFQPPPTSTCIVATTVGFAVMRTIVSNLHCHPPHHRAGLNRTWIWAWSALSNLPSPTWVCSNVYAPCMTIFWMVRCIILDTWRSWACMSLYYIFWWYILFSYLLIILMYFLIINWYLCTFTDLMV